MTPTPTNKLNRFWKNYDFPLHLFVCRDKFISLIVSYISTWRLKFILWIAGCRHGTGLRVDGRGVVRVARRGAVQLGNGVSINSRFGSNLAGLTNPTVFQCLGRGHIWLSDDSGCSRAVFSSHSGIEIGRRVLIGANTHIYDHDFHALDIQARRTPAADNSQCASYPVIIEDDVFVGANVIILKGVHIAKGSIIGTGAVVTLKEILPIHWWPATPPVSCAGWGRSRPAQGDRCRVVFHRMS